MNIIKFLTITLLFPFSSSLLVSNQEFPFEKWKKYQVTDEKKIEQINLESSQTDINYLQKDVIDNSVKIQKLSEQIDALTIELSVVRKEKIYFNCKDLQNACHTINTGNGMLFVSVKEAKPYLNGYRISLDIGNPNFVTYINPEINLSWNISFQQFWKNRTEARERQKNTDEKIQIPSWEDTLQKKSYCVIKRFLPGIWNEIDIDIPNVTLNQLEDCELSIKAGTVTLSKDPRIQ